MRVVAHARSRTSSVYPQPAIHRFTRRGLAGPVRSSTAKSRCHLSGNTGAIRGVQGSRSIGGGRSRDRSEGGNDVQSLTRRQGPAVAPAHAAPPRRSASLISVAVIGDDHQLLWRVRSALQREGVAGRIEDGGATHLRADRLESRPDVVVIGSRDPRVCIAEAGQAHRGRAGAHVIVVLESGAGCDVRRLLEAGVDGVVLEPDLEETVGLVVRAVCAGHVSVPRSMRHAIDPPEFSAREREIFTLVVAGLTNGEIAERRFLARSTVAGRLTSIFRRLGVQSRDEAVSLVMGADESLRERLVDRRAVRSPRAAAAER